MSRWKDLPGHLGPRARQLAVQLRRLKDRSGLSLTALAARTAYSRSSWDRYLNGRTPAPPGAVAELARVAGADAARLLALCDVAHREQEPEAARLAEVLRELRAELRLSLAELARRTAYSKSSWERYVNGKALPPRAAVASLCRLAGRPAARTLALWELAEPEWRGRAGGARRVRCAALQSRGRAEGHDLVPSAPVRPRRWNCHPGSPHRRG